MRVTRLLMPLAFSGVLCLAPAAHAQVTFSGPTNFATGANPDRLVVADFNGDGDLDAAVTTDDTQSLSILLGGPGATFGQLATLNAGSSPADLAVGDFNGDGDPDLAVADSADQINIFLGGAGASFSGPTSVPTTQGPQDVIVGNFNGDQDQDPDIAVSSGNGLIGVVSVHLGGQGGSFGPPSDHNIGGLLQSLVSADFNADGDPDLAVADTNGSRVSVFPGGAGGAFGSPTDFAADNAAYIDAGDFNGDGDPDIAVTDFSGDPPRFNVLTGGAGAAFSAPIPFPTGELELGIAVGRIDADTDPDVVTANNGAPSLSVLSGATGATFVPAATLATGGNQPRDVVLGDFDRDGKTDVAATIEDPVNGIGVFVNTGPGGGAAPPPVLGRLVNASVVKGKVLIAVPARGARAARAGASQKGLKFVALTDERQIPVGSFLDTNRGTVALESSTGSGARTQTGQFNAGVFQVLQSRKKRDKGLTELRLSGSSFKSCRSRGRRGRRAAASKLSHRTIRQLKGSAKGRYTTRGKHSAATVRGTIWTVADRCDGTLTKVSRGVVAVRDFRRKKTVLVRAGRSYLARAPG